MPLRFLQSQRWPRTAGFEIYGKGPCYVISVEKGSMAHHAGLLPGDQVLEVDGRDVTNMAADQIRALAKGNSQQPPELEVVSCLQTHVLKPDHAYGYGFTVFNGKPLTIGSVDYRGPAYRSGIRAGDIILEVKNRNFRSLDTIGTILSQRSGELTILAVPVARASNMVQMDKTLSRVAAPDPRLYKARDLHNKFESLLGDDYKSKIAVVSALKRYAEDRDITILCKALNDVLRTRQQRHILKQLRLLIPPSQRSQFDNLINAVKPAGSSVTSRPSSEIPSSVAHHLGQKKLIQVVREAGSFGFTVKSSSPAYIESTDPGGAAETAGLVPGDHILKLNGIDVRKCDHDKLVQLLQDSGSAPTLEILRYAKPGGTRSVISTSSSTSSSSSSSHNSVDNILYSNVIRDKDGYTFINKVQCWSIAFLAEQINAGPRVSTSVVASVDGLKSDKTTFLLTSKERTVMKKALRNYDMTRDITQLYDTTAEILDTPSKKMLWSFLFVLLSSPHREYVSHRVSLPVDVLMGIVKSDDGQNDDETNEQEQGPEELDISNFPPSFQQQIDFLLTSTERLQFKTCLKEYGKEQELSSLVKTLETILDTPSKRILWRLVLPKMTDGHREVMRGRLDLHGSQTASAPVNLTAMDSYIGTPEDYNEGQLINTATNTEDDILYGASKSLIPKDTTSSTDENDEPTVNRKRIKTRPRPGAHDSDLIRELEETKKAVQEVRDVLIAQGKAKEDDMADIDDLDKDLEYLDARRYVTIIPVSCPGGESKKRSPATRHSGLPQPVNPRKIKIPLGKGEGAVEEDLQVYPQDEKLPDSRVDESSDKDSCDDDNGDIKDEEFDFSASKGSNQSYTHKAMSALLQLDAAMADETSDADTPPTTKTNQAGRARTTYDHQVSTEDDTEFGGKNEDVQEKTEILKPRPPPPPPPPPPAMPPINKESQDNTARMSVKRINWERLDNKSVENTIWQKLNDSDLSEVIRYLELETQFSTMPSMRRDKEKKKEVLIMDKKKAYNISILLGHLKMSVAEVKQALYSMDENALSPELVGQLLAFVPNEHEIAQYKLYTGDKSLLTKPDQFAYQMSLVGDYEERLKALKFKASFREKIEEMRENLESVRCASMELRSSQKLARLLEVILAMGNYMNKGNPRVGEAAGFRISFLNQLDITKTADKKSSFLHVLADAAYSKFPEVLSLSDELSTVDKAAKVSIQALTQDVQDLRKALQETSAVLYRIADHTPKSQPQDRFKDVMGHFISEATDEIQSILRLQAVTMTEFSKTVTFFGEDPKTMSVSDVFEIFSEFIRNFEKAHRHNLMFKRQ